MTISKHTSITLAVFVIAILFRLQNFFLLPIDAHPMRQTDTESVAYYFATTDANPLHPQASLIRPQTNIHGYFFLEVPVYQYVLSLFYRVFGTSVVVARVFNLALFTLSFWLVYMGVKQLFSERLSLWAVIIYSFIPSSIFFLGHAIHPDLFAITTILGSIYLLSVPNRKMFHTLLATLLLAVSVGTRPFILMALPSLIVTLYLNKGKIWEYIVLTIGSVSIYGLWSKWQTLFPEADHSWQYWTLGGREALYTFEGWKHLFWRNVSGEVIGRVVTLLTAIGICLLAIQLLKKTQFISRLWKKPHQLSYHVKLLLFCGPWLAAVPVYWWIAPAGNAAHQYYANVFVLPIIFLAAFAAERMQRFSKVKSIQMGVSALILVAILYNGFRTSSYFYHDIVPSHFLAIANDIEAHVPKGNKIVYLATNNSVPFSLAHRQGWMLGGAPTDVGNTADDVLKMEQYGANYFVYAKNNYDISNAELEKIAKQTQLVYESEQVKIFGSLSTQ